MKKILAILLPILLLTIAFVSCNLDGTTGILWDVAQSKKPLDIRYKQLLGIGGTDLYFRTAKGVERVTTAKLNTTVVASKYEHIIQAAALSGSEVFYITNNEDERSANQVRVIVTTNLSAIPGTITVTAAEAPSVATELSIKALYANSMILVTGKNGSGAKVFDLLKYSSVAPVNFKTPIASFASLPAGYDIESVIQQTAKEQDATAPMIVSFISADGKNREHHLVEPSGATTSLGTENVQIANFIFKATNTLYVLTTDGKIYHVNGTTWTSIGTSSKTYETNAFVLAIKVGTKYYLITKPSSKTSSLHVFTIDDATPTTSIGSGVDVKSGYAKELALATIVSAQLKLLPPAGTTTLWVATDENGMYNISITDANVTVDDSSNGTSSEGEGYSFP
ncbi:MAG: hypothetical protein EOM68_08315 [Spirochaetia bacterium]|nr:hypothetical protein [Spirochaetia bacterium]